MWNSLHTLRSVLRYMRTSEMILFTQKSYYSKHKNKLITAKELKFPTHYGHIAAQEWGYPNGHPVLALHGLLDNSGSFEPLIPYILKPNNLHIIAIDYPGNGLSSHKPLGSEYTPWNALIDIKRVIDQLKWRKFTLIGHSLGGHFSLLFGSIYPHLVDRIIAIDIFKPLAYDNKYQVRGMGERIDNHIKYESMLAHMQSTNTETPVYSEKEAIKRIMILKSMNEKSATIMMKRGTRAVEEGVVFRRDIRWRPGEEVFYLQPNHQQMIDFVTNLRSDLLVIRGKQSYYYNFSKDIRKLFYECYQNNCRIFKDVLLDGTHHLHMNNPETVGPIINKFISISLASRLKRKPIL